MIIGNEVPLPKYCRPAYRYSITEFTNPRHGPARPFPPVGTAQLWSVWTNHPRARREVEFKARAAA